MADAIEKHAMRYTQYRGLSKVKAEATLRFACMNLKKLAKWKRIKGLLEPFIRGFIQILAQVIQKSVANPMLQPTFVYSPGYLPEGAVNVAEEK